MFVDLGKFALIFSAIIVTDRETRKSRGFGYVTFTNEVDAKEAMSSMAGERGKVPVTQNGDRVVTCCFSFAAW